VVVGAGIAGLSCAVNLQKQGMKPLLVEASDGVSMDAYSCP
jgi:flavin-dependent dehydrogenase